MHDPRNGLRVSERDIRALAFIGEGYEVAQYQLQAAIFPNVSAVVVSHFVTRAVRNGWIAVERWNRVGINRLRLTASGRHVVVRAGGDPVGLFVPKKPVASKDVAHTLWINDVRVALRAIRPRFDAVLPAWQLQRRFVPAPAAIPDILAIRGGDHPFVLACEVDLGAERLVATFLPKLRALHRLVDTWSAAGAAHIIVFTRGTRRTRALNDFAVSEGVQMNALPLPSRIGTGAPHSLASTVQTVLELAVNTYEPPVPR